MFNTFRTCFNIHLFMHNQNEIWSTWPENLVNISQTMGVFFAFCADTDFLLGQHDLKIWSTNWGTYPTRSAHITCRI